MPERRLWNIPLPDGGEALDHQTAFFVLTASSFSMSFSWQLLALICADVPLPRDNSKSTLQHPSTRSGVSFFEASMSAIRARMRQRCRSVTDRAFFALRRPTLSVERYLGRNESGATRSDTILFAERIDPSSRSSRRTSRTKPAPTMAHMYEMANGAQLYRTATRYRS
ncbi:hypothetical protein DFH09DRAFT_357006 [Mycena vulgaris]|nr:hypothetical protein DFH09DRAFT_357006 [Mycena vulgaris]